MVCRVSAYPREVEKKMIGKTKIRENEKIAERD